MSKFKHVLLIGANFSNKGAEAMLLTVKNELSRREKDTKFYMLCRQYEKELAEEKGIVPIYDESGELARRFKSLKWRVRGKLTKILTGKDRPFVFSYPFESIKKHIPKLDAVIDISGFAYADSWGKPMIQETIKLQNYSKRKKAKFFFLPQAWGSFDNPDVAAAAKEMLSKADKFYARDTVSRKYLASVLGREESSITMLPDIAFNYKGSEISGESLLNSIGYNKNDRLLIGISPNLRVYERTNGQGKDNEYVKILLALCNYCLNALNADIVLIPNEIFPDGNKSPDDRVLCGMINDMIKSERCFIVDRYCSSDEIKAFVSQVDLLVSSRFHALIFGLLHHVPVMAISWSHKYKELFSLFGLEDFVLEWNAMDETSALNLFKKLLQEREEVRLKISTNIKGLQEKGTDMFDQIVATSR